jgi:hypothetical protein
LVRTYPIDHNTGYYCSIVTVTEKKQFPDWSAFEKWKESHEAATFTYYIRPKGSQAHNDG